MSLLVSHMEGGCVGREAVRGVAPLAIDLAVPLHASLDRMHRRRGQLLTLLAKDDLVRLKLRLRLRLRFRLRIRLRLRLG